MEYLIVRKPIRVEYRFQPMTEAGQWYGAAVFVEKRKTSSRSSTLLRWSIAMAERAGFADRDHGRIVRQSDVDRRVFARARGPCSFRFADGDLRIPSHARIDGDVVVEHVGMAVVRVHGEQAVASSACGM